MTARKKALIADSGNLIRQVSDLKHAQREKLQRDHRFDVVGSRE